MNLPSKRAIARAMLATACLALIAAVISLTVPRRQGSYAGVPPGRSEYLRDVVEPITMVEAMSWDDGGSKGLVFKDSTGEEFGVCLMNDLDDDHHLRFGSDIPSHGRPVPIGGIEERAFLGLLERWARQSHDARVWVAKIQVGRIVAKIEAGLKKDPRFSILNGDESDEQRGNAFAVSIMNRLRRRN